MLFYSANFFGNGSYLSSYATATSLRGPYTKAAAPLMTTDAFAGTVRGPGGQDIVTGPDGKDRIIFHGWDPAFGYRAMYSQRLDWQGSRPIVDGAKVRYEAEDADFTRANARYASGASNGAVVGGIDFDDSRVTFTVYVPRAGTYRLHTRFANGPTPVRRATRCSSTAPPPAPRTTPSPAGTTGRPASGRSPSEPETTPSGTARARTSPRSTPSTSPDSGSAPPEHGPGPGGAISGRHEW